MKNYHHQKAFWKTLTQRLHNKMFCLLLKYLNWIEFHIFLVFNTTHVVHQCKPWHLNNGIIFNHLFFHVSEVNNTGSLCPHSKMQYVYASVAFLFIEKLFFFSIRNKKSSKWDFPLNLRQRHYENSNFVSGTIWKHQWKQDFKL